MKFNWIKVITELSPQPEKLLQRLFDECGTNGTGGVTDEQAEAFYRKVVEERKCL